MKKNIALLLASLVVGLVLSELALRYFGIYKSYNERSYANGKYISPFTPNPVELAAYNRIKYTKDEFATDWIANSDGLNNPEIPVLKKGNRVIFLGDSFTEGAGAPNDSAYPRIFEKILRTNGDASTEVINAGISGADLFTEYKLLKEKLLKYQPDCVILTINSTDFDEYAIRGGFERWGPNNQLHYRKPPWFEALYAKSYVTRLIVHKVFKYDFAFLKPGEKEANRLKANASMEAAIDSFKLLCDTNNIALGLVFHPRNFEIAEPRKYPLKNLELFSARNKIPFIDAFLVFKQNHINAANANTIYWPKDGHLKPKGYDLLAQGVFEFYRQNLNH